MFAKIIDFLFPSFAVKAQTEKQKEILAFELCTTYPHAERIIAPCLKLLELGESNHVVADLLAEHTDLFEVMEFAMKLKPPLAKKFADVSKLSAEEHLKLCGHSNRAHWARASIRFVDKCYDKIGYKPNSFNALFAEVMQKTAWAFEGRAY